MKKFTFNDVKEFCKKHYGEYMQEEGTAITFSFIGQDSTRKMGFLDLAEGTESELSGTWQYVDCDTFGKNGYVFNFKRTA